MQPGVEVVHTTIKNRALASPTAIPVFVGFTELGDSGPILQSIASLADYEEQFGKPADAAAGERAPRCALYYALAHYFKVSGEACFVASVGTYEELSGLDADGIQQRLTSDELFACLKSEPTISLFVVPDLALFNADDEIVHIQDSWTAIATKCAESQRLFALIDAPASHESATSMLEWVNAGYLGESIGNWAAAYWPYLTVLSPQGDRIDIPPSASVAAMIQVTDANQGIWTAPANVELPKIIKPQYSYLDGANLFKDEEGASINLIRSFSGRGVRVWGNRTLNNSSAIDESYRYIQLRRLVSYIENSLANIGRFAVFEPNNEITWLKLEGICGAWLRALWRRGALFGTNESDAFKVSVGLGETMTEEDITSGKLIMSVSLALQYPAEFISVSVQFDTRTVISEA